MLADVIVAFAGMCITHEMSSGTADMSESGTGAADLFASTAVSSQQLEAVLHMPRQRLQSASQEALFHPAAAKSSQSKINALLIAAASPLLGLPEVTSADFNSKQGSSGLIHRALQDTDAPVQAVAAALLPVVVANVAEAAKGGAKGQHPVGIRLLQKGLDCVLSLLGHEGSISGVLKTAVAHAAADFVSMQAVTEHRAQALCKAANPVAFVSQHIIKASNTNRSSSATARSPTLGASTQRCVTGLDCWPRPRQKLKDLPLTGHAGAHVPFKAIKSFADALLFSKEHDLHEGHKAQHKVCTAWMKTTPSKLTCACACVTSNLLLATALDSIQWLCCLPAVQHLLFRDWPKQQADYVTVSPSESELHIREFCRRKV